MATDVARAPGGADLALVAVPGLAGNIIAPTAACMSGGTSARVVSVRHDAAHERTTTPAQADLDLPGCDYRVASSRRMLLTWTQRAGVCSGDSGSPAIVQTPEGQRVIGVVTNRVDDPGRCTALKGVVFAAGYVTRTDEHASWVDTVTAHAPTPPALHVVLQSGTIADTLMVDPRWSGWRLRLEAHSGGASLDLTIAHDGSTLAPVRLHRGAWTVRLWHPEYTYHPEPATVHSLGPKVEVTSVVRRGRTLSVTGMGERTAQLAVKIMSGKRTVRRATLRPGITRISLPRPVRRGASVRLTFHGHGRDITIIPSTARTASLTAPAAVSAPAPAPISTAEPAPITTPVGPWLTVPHA